MSRVSPPGNHHEHHTAPVVLEYPAAERQGCGYAIRYLRWLCESGAAAEVGPIAVALLTAVATVEDELHYQRPPNFFRDQLLRRSGITSVHALDRARQRAIEAGLLEYRPGGKRRPATYYVRGFGAQGALKARQSRTESANEPRPSIPYTQYPVTPTPNPVGPEAPGPGDARPPLADGGEAMTYPLVAGSWRLSAERMAEYRVAYPWDVLPELRKAALWLRDHRDRRPRSARGLYQYLTRWLNRADDARRRHGGADGPAGAPAPGGDDVLARLEAMEAAESAGGAQ